MKINYSAVCLLPFALSLVALTGCSTIPKADAEAQSKSASSPQKGAGITPVDVAIASKGTLQEKIEYTGTTKPLREVALRSQAEGRLKTLELDVGDPVKKGQIIAQLDDALLQTAVAQAQAELLARRSEVARAQTQVSNARVKLQQARVELQQVQTDAARNAQLARSGAISRQQAELAQTAARTAEQVVLSAREQIRTEEQAVVAARGRVAAQQAIVAQNRERLSYALVPSPIAGVVVGKLQERGNLVTPSTDILKLGDFSSVKIEVPVSELELSNIRVGQSVRVRLDAFAKEPFSGAVSRISPAADATARQVPIEVTIPNRNGKIGSGLLARVNFSSTAPERVLVPQTALQETREPRSAPSAFGGSGEQRSNAGAGSANGSSSKQTTSGQNPPSSGEAGGIGSKATLFVITNEFAVVKQGNEDLKYPKVRARTVTSGDRANGKVEILSGLNPGERYVARSGNLPNKPLKDGDPVRVSVLSQKR